MNVDPQLLALLQRWHATKTNYDAAQRAQEAGAVALVEAERALASWLAQRGVVLTSAPHMPAPPIAPWPQPPPPAPPYPYPPYAAAPPPAYGPPPHPQYAQHPGAQPVNEEDAGEVVLREMRGMTGAPDLDGMNNGPIT